MEEAYQEGRLWAIGVCNFHAARLLDFCESVEMRPYQEQNRSSQEHRILIFFHRYQILFSEASRIPPPI